MRKQQLVLPISGTRNEELSGPLTGFSPCDEIPTVSWDSSSCGPSFLGIRGVSSLPETQKQTQQDILVVLRILYESRPLLSFLPDRIHELVSRQSHWGWKWG